MVDNVKTLFAAYFDRTAQPQQDKTWKKNILTAAGAIFTGAVAYFDSLTKIGHLINDKYSNIVASLVALVGFLLCMFVIGSRELTRTAGISSSTEIFKYSHRQSVRSLCKLCGIGALALLTIKLVAAIHDFQPIPSPLYGRLMTDRGKPIVGAAVTAFAGDGRDLTDGTFISDDQGFYFLRTRHPMPRSGFLLANTPICPEQRLEVLRKNEVHGRYIERFGTTSAPVFEHTLLGCKE